jgi:glycosyltransferase involved in cell wall biosynthesis
MKRWFTRLFVLKDFKHAAAIQATTPAEAAELREQFGLGNIIVIPHGVSLRDGEIDRTTAKKNLRLPENAKVVLFLSRIATKKRPEWVVEAMRRLLPEFPDLTGIFAGPDAGAEATLSAAIAASDLNGRVKRVGFVTGEDKSTFFAAADVLALPSQSENFGVVVVEAMAHGLPVVVTPGVASHIYVDESGCGITVDDNVDALTDGIRKIFQADKNELGQRGREYVRQHLTWQAVGDQLDQVYRKVIQCRTL